VTVAAQAELEYTGRTGCLLVGTTNTRPNDSCCPNRCCSSGCGDWLLSYIQLIARLLQPTQIVEALPITQERQRAQRRLSWLSGVDCSGFLRRRHLRHGWVGWKNYRMLLMKPACQLFPGITACCRRPCRDTPDARLCAISLSDLHAWQVIEKRLAAAAKADLSLLFIIRVRNRIQQMAC